MKSIIENIPAFRRVQYGVLMLMALVLFGTLGYVIIGALCTASPGAFWIRCS